jgi:hypothetical protein
MAAALVKCVPWVKATRLACFSMAFSISLTPWPMLTTAAPPDPSM